MSLQTEFEFVLPKGYIDKDGNLHREGTMRLANAKDEILPLQDPRVVRNQGFLIVILLSRVITRLGDLRESGSASASAGRRRPAAVTTRGTAWKRARPSPTPRRLATWRRLWASRAPLFPK